MNSSKQINLDVNNLAIVYRHYKDYVIPVGIILASLIILFFVVIPQVQQFFVLQASLQTETNNLQNLKNNYNFLSALDSSRSDSNLNTLSLVLPPDKDFVGIMSAISTAASNANVSVGDFSFSLGNLSSAAGAGGTQYPSIKIESTFTGSAQNILKFVYELYKTSPVSQVTKIDLSGSSADIIMIFYYKPYPPQNVDDQSPVVPYSANDLSLIKRVSSWNNSSNQPFFPFLPVAPASSSATSANASSSATSNPSPF